ncbi:MAG: V-type ATP synthase subunit E [Simkaniaceae bacterium]|nr:V-type ATP synthase subunit E [Candidatus Sacchlamyda saccharinae]
MTQDVESGRDKVKQICEVLRKETLEPAIDEAKKVLEDAESKAGAIVAEAKEKAAKLVADAEADIEKKYGVFKASLNQGARQSVAWLKQEIEERLLNQNLGDMITKATSSPQVIADMVSAVIKAVGEEGLDTDLSVIIPAAVEPNQVNELIGKNLVENLKEKSVIVGPQKGGVEMKLHKDKITIDLSDTALVELLTRYVRKDFHKYFFAGKQDA